MPRKYGRPTGQVCFLNVNAIIIPEWVRDIDRSYLADSIDEKDVIVPIIVGKIRGDKSGKYILIDGRGRLETAIRRGDKEILARVVKIESEEEALLLAIELEHTKQPWDPEYTLKVIKYLEGKGYSRKKIAEILKIPRSTLYRILKLETVEPEIKEKVVKGEIPLRALDSEKALRQYLEPKEPEEQEIEEGEFEEVEVEDKYVTVDKIDIDKMRRETEEAVASIIKAHRPDIQVEVLSEEDLQPTTKQQIDTIMRNVSTLKLANWTVKGPFLFVYLAEEELDLSTLIDIYQRTGCTFTILPYKIRNFKLRFWVAKRENERGVE